MPDRKVSVTLAASTAAYQSAMRAAAASTTQFVTASTANLTKLGSQMQSVGRKMSVGLTLPLVGAGVASVKMATDFEGAFSRMVGLAGVPAAEVDVLRESVLALSGETGQAPRRAGERAVRSGERRSGFGASNGSRRAGGAGRSRRNGERRGRRRAGR